MVLPVLAPLNYSLTAYYRGDTCTGAPYFVKLENGGDFCSNETCVVNPLSPNSSSSTADVDRVSIVCSTDFLGAMKELFDRADFLVRISFEDPNCTYLDFGLGYSATTDCVGAYDQSGGAFYYKNTLHNNATATLEDYNSSSCSSSSLTSTETVGRSDLVNHACGTNAYRWYSSLDENDGGSAATESSASSTSDSFHIDASSSGSISAANESSGSSSGIVVWVVVGIIVVIAAIVAIVFFRRRNKSKYEDSHARPTSSTQAGSAASLESAVNGQRGLWNDDVITAKRIPRDKLHVKKLLSRGAYGEVYSGLFNRQQVAIKMLIPATRASIQHVNAFLAEAKMTAIMDHPHVVSFIGVAWDSLSDLCVVLEFMDGGDLRTLLDKYLASRHSVGFDRQKGTIALHVCHALAYLHSLAPPVIHRDLKSRNILLSKTMEAKLTDFGISRERLDRTMTAGVGTSLWMAPEVMLGERYDVKADMFSFGVVLSELDVHTFPYAQTKKQSCESEGRKLTDATLLQRVATGSIRVEFSESNLLSITELGNACISVDPNDRPSAAEALYKLQVVLAQELA
ncbi:TKL protein kinase [Phytophthora cinnamomi]|uniref:TKL protein kinase n=1 Tax=Phytophthora cinnamomi TaxID=4785 RepID=UPI00355A3714|nr:TKL protein kinase [Phytophthora cinnamomi]